MAKVTLAKALKQRKRLIQQVTQLDARIARNNSVLEGNSREGSVVEMLAERRKLIDKVVATKVAMYNANAGVQHRIFLIAELKGLIQSLQTLDTKEGKQDTFGYRNAEASVYNAELSRTAVETKIADLEAEIDAIQDEIDQYNHNTEVVLP